jgi:hypothetical protein
MQKIPAGPGSLMPSTAIQPPVFDLTVRVGCSLAYQVTGTASLLLNLQPRPNRNHAVIFEALALGANLPAEHFTDSHGNRVTRVTLAPGANFFRHDAIVVVSSRPDNHRRRTSCRRPCCATRCRAGIAIRTS